MQRRQYLKTWLREERLQAGIKDMSDQLSRRQLLELVGKAGGSAAVYQVALALGMMPGRAAAERVSVAKAPAGAGKNILLLGAGLANLCIAYELEKAGYQCTFVESSERIGGRSLTLRAGDTVDEIGQPRKVMFDNESHLYFNAGPARIPAHHHLLHGYCRELGVELEWFVNDNRYALTQDDASLDGKPVMIREYMADARGFMSELLAKAINKNIFSEEFSKEDSERLFEFVRRYGDLDEKGFYKGTARAGYASGGMIEPGVKKGPLDFSELLKNNFWKSGMHFPDGESQSAPLMQAVGGNDHVFKAFLPHLKSTFILNAPVISITNTPAGVDVVYSHEGKHKKISADYCFNSIPLPLMTGVDNNFSGKYREGIAKARRGKLTKIAFQTSERFWEKEDIYGGISWTNQPVQQIWYPSHGVYKQKGVMLASYTWSRTNSEAFGRMSPEQRLEDAKQQVSKVHADFPKYVENGVSVVWHRMNHHLGCTTSWSAEDKEKYFKTMQMPDGRHYMVGDQISYHSGWQEGAFSSAHFALAHFNERVHKA